MNPDPVVAAYEHTTTVILSCVFGGLAALVFVMLVVFVYLAGRPE